MPLAEVSTGIVLVRVVLVTLPIAAIACIANAGDAFDGIGRGELSIGEDEPARSGSGGGIAPVSAEVRKEEIRQMVQARSDRGVARGRDALDVDAEVERLLAPERGAGSLGADRGLREEVRQLVVARNERRVRRGEEPLDVEDEVSRRLRELENLGQ